MPRQPQHEPSFGAVQVDPAVVSIPASQRKAVDVRILAAASAAHFRWNSADVSPRTGSVSLAKPAKCKITVPAAAGTYRYSVRVTAGSAVADRTVTIRRLEAAEAPGPISPPVPGSPAFSPPPATSAGAGPGAVHWSIG